MTKVPPLILDTYLTAIRNSAGSKMFRNAFFLIDGKKRDVLRNGDLSCAVYVSSMLLLFGLIPLTHTTVRRTIEDMRRAGWHRVRRPKVGSVIVWGPKTFRKSGETHKHIGFYLGKGKAISNNAKKGCPVIHHWTFGMKHRKPKRAVETIYWNKRLG